MAIAIARKTGEKQSRADGAAHNVDHFFHGQRKLVTEILLCEIGIELGIKRPVDRYLPIGFREDVKG